MDKLGSVKIDHLTVAAKSEHRSWSVVAPFFRAGHPNAWLDDYLGETELTFRKIARAGSRDNWHARAGRATGLNTWIEYWKQSERAFPASGVITVFPQLAITTALQCAILRQDIPQIAWCFNLGQFPGGWRRTAARAALRKVDRFVVHSTGEVMKVSEFLDLAPGKVEFVPLQRAPIPVQAEEDLESPFIVSMGSANRDYVTFLKAAEITGLPCKIVAPPRSIEGLTIPANVMVQSGITHSECHALVQKSRFSVVPLMDPDIASGQVTVIESMRMSRAVIATESIGTSDYLRNRWNGTLVPPSDAEELAASMLELWEDQLLRRRYVENATNFAELSLSDQAASQELARIIASIESKR